MRLKTILLTAILVFCLVFTTACQSISPDNPLSIYKSANVEVSLIENIENTDTITYTCYDWEELTDDVAYTKNTVIITGTASNVRQATVAYEFMDADVVDNITIFDVEVSDVLACRSGSFRQGDLITIGVGYNMNTYGNELPIIEDGKSYLIFCYVAADQENDVLELAGYMDCWISAPKDLFLEKVGDYYLSIDYFSGMPSSVQIADCLSLTEEQIASMSRGRINNPTAIISYLDKEITSDVEGATEALSVLMSRTVGHSTELWDLTNRSYIICCDELEEYVSNVALTYGD